MAIALLLIVLHMIADILCNVAQPQLLERCRTRARSAALLATPPISVV